MITTNKTDAPSYTRTTTGSTDAEFQARRQTILNQISQVNREIASARVTWGDQNPEKSSGDWLRSTEFKTLNRKKQALQADLNNL